MSKKVIYLGNYNNNEIYYNRELKKIETTGLKVNNYNESIVTAAILISVPLLKIIDSKMINKTLEMKILILFLGAVIGIILGNVVKNKVYKNLKFRPLEMNKNQFEDFYKENIKNIMTLKWIVFFITIPLIIEIIVYLYYGIFTVAFVFIINVFVVSLLFLSGVHIRGKIYKEIIKSL